MTKIVQKDRPRDHYRATIEDGSLMMRPYCSCGNILDEDYICDKCDRRCHCNLILCDSEATLKMAKTYARKSRQFSAFTVKLAE